MRHVKSRQFGSQYAMVNDINDIKGLKKSKSISRQGTLCKRLEDILALYNRMKSNEYFMVFTRQ